jgi:hypothetical protein
LRILPQPGKREEKLCDQHEARRAMHVLCSEVVNWKAKVPHTTHLGSRVNQPTSLAIAIALF